MQADSQVSGTALAEFHTEKRMSYILQIPPLPETDRK